MDTSLAEEAEEPVLPETPPPPPHPAKIINIRATSKIESWLLFLNMLFSSSANSAKILLSRSLAARRTWSQVTHKSRCSASLGFPRFALSRERITNLNSEMRQRPFENPIHAEAIIPVIQKKVCDIHHPFMEKNVIVITLSRAWTDKRSILGEEDIPSKSA